MNDNMTDLNTAEWISEPLQQLCLFWFVLHTIKTVHSSFKNLSSLDQKPVILK